MPLVFLLECFTRNLFVGFFILFNGLINDILGQEIVAVRIGFQPVTDILFVVAGLALSNFVASKRPEAGTVRRQHLIAKDDLTIFIKTKFKFGIGNDDALRVGIISTFFIKGNGRLFDGFVYSAPLPGKRFSRYSTHWASEMFSS